MATALLRRPLVVDARCSQPSDALARLREASKAARGLRWLAALTLAALEVELRATQSCFAAMLLLQVASPRRRVFDSACAHCCRDFSQLAGNCYEHLQGTLAVAALWAVSAIRKAYPGLASTRARRAR